MRTLCATLIAVATALASGEAFAQEHWSLNGGDTVRSGDDLIAGEFGWPDASFQWDHGVTDKVDVGIRFSMIYGVEYTVDFTHFGIGLGVPIRINVAHSSRVSALIFLEPGLRVFTANEFTNHASFGPQWPIGVQLGIHINPELQITAGLLFDMWLDVTEQAPVNPLFAMAPLVGPGVEYHVDRNLGVGLDMKFGPAILIDNGDLERFAMKLQAGIMYHF
ncbi:MAG TPA: hypothetical protein VHB21_08560 [Minicystis sp.]|nr:hypothetical protein [Minicystis sp.]